jgi:hypothetical protein
MTDIETPISAAKAQKKACIAPVDIRCARKPMIMTMMSGAKITTHRRMPPPYQSD